MTDKQTIIDKIQKLMRRTAENGASQAEVEAAMKAAQKLMEKHAIEMAAVLESQSRELGMDDIDKVMVRETSKLDRWEKNLAFCVAILTSTKWFRRETYVFDASKGKHRKVFQVWYYGEKSDLSAAHALYVELLIVFKAMAKSRLGKKWTQSHWHYMDGFGQGMIQVHREEQEAWKSRQATNCTTMIVHKEQLILNYERDVLSLKQGRASRTRKNAETYDAMKKGIADGRNYKGNAPKLPSSPKRLN